MALHAPQLITNAEMVYLVWLPAEPDAVAALVPDGLTAAPGAPVYMNQYLVRDPGQTSNGAHPDGFGAYSLTYLGVDLAGLDTEDGTPGRWWTHYLNSSPPMIDYARAHGVPAAGGSTTLELSGDTLVATTSDGGRPVVRTTARAAKGTPVHATGQLRYVTRLDGELVSGRYPYVMDMFETCEVRSVEFLDPSHPAHVMRPADPLQVTFAFYSQAITFCYPGGEGPLGSVHGS